MPHASLRGGLPITLPSLRAPLRLAFVGQSTFFEACALADGLGGMQSRFFEFRGGGDLDALLAQLEDFAPHVVVAFRPEIFPPGALHGLGAAVLGFLTEPLPRQSTTSHPDLERRLWELSQVDGSNFDRIVAFDPLIAQTADDVLPVWRSLPLPVADRYYRPVKPIEGKPNVLFVGRSTPHREALLEPIKRYHEVVHMAFGVDAAELERLMAEHEVGINIHNHPYLSFENRVCIHLAAGHLVFSEPLLPTHGLEPGIDYLEIHTSGTLVHLVECVKRFPGIWHPVRVRGRRKAEQFRASRVYPRLVADFLRDLSAYGTERPGAAGALPAPVAG
jgi:hypothetical protein